MTGHGEKLTRQQDAAIAALLTSPNIRAAAQQAGIGEKTLFRWLRIPAFQTAYSQARGRIVEAAIGRLQQAATTAIDTLERNMTCGHPPSEIAASRAVLDNMFRGLETRELVERIERLEAAATQAEDHAP